MGEFQISKSDFTQVRVIESDFHDHQLANGQILVQVEQFAYTTNNISYAIAGERFGYWKYFPTSNGTDDWVVTPVWGFGKVIKTNNSDVTLNSVIYGFLPTADQVILTPTQVSQFAFVENSLHRKDLDLFYNQYEIVTENLHYSRADDNARMVFGPLHQTAFVMLHFLQDSAWKGAEQIIILSASSKTSLGMAYGFCNADAKPTLVGVTSSKNVESLDRLNLYDEIVSYDNIEGITSDVPTLLIDMSGRNEIINDLFSKLGDQMISCIQVGRTHWTEPRSKSEVPREKIDFFFAPTYMVNKQKEWGKDTYDAALADFVKASTAKISTWLSYISHTSFEDLAKVHQRLSNGSVPPEEATIIQLKTEL